MPIYEYQCDCGNKEEVILSVQDGDKPQVCKCGKAMLRKLSVSSFVMKPTGNGMALDTLNSKENGMPNRHWKPTAERIAVEGL